MWLVAATMAEEMGESWQGEKKMETRGLVPPLKKNFGFKFLLPHDMEFISIYRG
jgi:hypothetical protein